LLLLLLLLLRLKLLLLATNAPCLHRLILLTLAWQSSGSRRGQRSVACSGHCGRVQHALPEFTARYYISALQHVLHERLQLLLWC
jgi:hypothetical protein